MTERTTRRASPRGSPRRGVWLAAIPAAGLLGWLAYTSLAPAPHGALREPYLEPFEALGEFRVSDRIERRHGLRYTLSRGEGVVKVEVLRGIDEAAAGALLEDGIVTLEALAADALSPYPGDISRKIVPGEEYRPRRITRRRGGRTYDYYLLYANDRFGYGVGTPESAAYKSLAGWIHCPSLRAFYRIRVFIPASRPTEELERLYLSLGCP